jgi:hypothetical protein
MEPERRQQIALSALAIVLLGAALYVYWPQTTTPAARPASRVRSSTSGGAAPLMTAPDVHLEALHAAPPKPEGVNRNLFRFKPKPAPAPPQEPAVPRPAPATPSATPGPPPLPDIPLKFAGILTQGPVKIAILIDSLGHSIYGKEGDTIEGRYKIWRIGVESIDISYLDGRGRKAIRMSGS